MLAWFFMLYLDNCLQGMKQIDVEVIVCYLNVDCLLYAVDAALIASSECELQAWVTTLKEGCENNGLSLNPSKTKVLVFERNYERN